jgi:hypothetical protein
LFFFNRQNLLSHHKYKAYKGGKKEEISPKYKHRGIIPLTKRGGTPKYNKKTPKPPKELYRRRQFPGSQDHS